MKRKIITAALAVIAAVALVGCQAVPRAGNVELGLADLSQAEQVVQFNPLGPVAGSSQEDIVRGFLLAASSSEDDYAVAREFLTPQYSVQWEPTLGVTVDEGSRPFTGESDLRGSMELDAVATINPEGELLPVMPGLATDLRFEFAEVDEEWRISSAPAGIVLDRVTFAAIWSAHQLNFFGPRDTLVPDTRWYQNTASLPTEITEGLLAGPSSDDSVTSAFPQGTQLIGETVPVIDGSARVGLSSNVLEAGEEQLALMHRQLTESMSTVPGVTGVEIYVDDVLVRLPDVEGELGPATPETTNPAVLVEGQFGLYTSGELTELPTISEAIVAQNPNAITLSLDDRLAVVRSSDGVSLLADDESVSIASGTSMLEPSLDRFGYVWIYDDGALHAVDQTGERVPIEARWLEGLTPVAVRVSPDGGRIAALVPSSGSQSAVVVSTIVRDETGKPLTTSDDAETNMYATGSPVDLDWIDKVRFAALTRVGSQAWVTVGGPGLIPNQQGAVPDGVSLSSGGSRTQLRVLSDDGSLYVSQGSSWQRALGGVEVLAKRG